MEKRLIVAVRALGKGRKFEYFLEAYSKVWCLPTYSGGSERVARLASLNFLLVSALVPRRLKVAP